MRQGSCWLHTAAAEFSSGVSVLVQNQRISSRGGTARRPASLTFGANASRPNCTAEVTTTVLDRYAYEDRRMATTSVCDFPAICPRSSYLHVQGCRSEPISGLLCDTSRQEWRRVIKRLVYGLSPACLAAWTFVDSVQVWCVVKDLDTIPSRAYITRKWAYSMPPAWSRAVEQQPRCIIAAADIAVYSAFMG